MQYNGRMPQVAEQTGQTTSDREGWDELTAPWYAEAYAQETQSQPYLFHQANPYAMGAPIVRELSPTTMGVLELEAALQQEPRDASAWLALGLKQQENEREDAAIRALQRAVELQPETRAAWLALAVSYTNEGKDDRAHDALERWLDLTQGGGAPETMGESRDERAARIINRLIDIARQNPDDLDVDVQVALGVLFNASEDYAKAEDCFTAALEARPDDWVLYNRLGATLANSGRSHEAIKFYHRALGLHPNFVRAQFNLGISYINLAQYRLAAQCILDAIRLQHSDVTEGYGADTGGGNTKGVTSEALWTTLRMACLHLQRPDLVTLANHHDLSGFPLEL
jgi:peroxin-5